jgi:polysaccharide deacetylase family protein (PEP-CTERM system associated)
MLTNVMSVDVEEYYHAAIFRKGSRQRALTSAIFPSRVEQSVEKLLSIMSEHDATATFFVLGEVAEAHPAMIRRIAAGGHEVACHGNLHEDVHRQTPGEFRGDIREAKLRIEDVIGQRVDGYRAPNFSIGADQTWAYEILAEEGFLYDSSVYPIYHDRYGRPDAPRFPYEIWRRGASNLWEFPIGTARLLGVNLPIGGGGYFRLAPLAFVRRGIARVNAHERRPVMVYLHPWELDSGQPRPSMPWHHRFRHYVGVQRHAAKVDRLLGHFRFGTARQSLKLFRPATAGA